MLSSDSEQTPDYGEDDAEVATGEFKNEQDSEDEPREMAATWRATSVKAEGDQAAKTIDELWTPTRVTEALKASKSFSEFRSKRTFTFLHMFCGEEDVLGDAIIRLADQADIKLKVMSLDRDRDGMDLTAEQPFGDLLGMARTGQFDGSHAGFPCGSFSRVRYRRGSGPPPVRNLSMDSPRTTRDNKGKPIEVHCWPYAALR